MPMEASWGFSPLTEDVLYEPCLLIMHCPTVFPTPILRICAFTSFPKGSHSSFQSARGISLEFSVTLGMPTACTAYASKSFCFTSWDTPQQRQRQFWANWAKGDTVNYTTGIKMGSWITSMKLRIISPKEELPKEISGIFHWHLYFCEGFL